MILTCRIDPSMEDEYLPKRDLGAALMDAARTAGGWVDELISRRQMPSKARHEAQAQHNRGILDGLPENALDWRATLMMYPALHVIRASISDVRPGDQNTGFNDESIPRILQREVPTPLVEVASAFVILKRLSQAARYECRDERWPERKLPEAQAAYDDILERLRGLGISI
ncbi:hypothetical protein [Deinococcus aestuarii]|uniref:hypothetical protein n=1 Tax=Deinococcus aestuarii TaxID=2774531 RepID=UPI001C0D77D7|nr:hypothetical protein [Deinococcus aestuarii]